MKYMDKVRVVSDNYQNQNVCLGEIGMIINPEIRENEFYIIFDNNDYEWYKYCAIKVEDLELVEEGNYSDEQILQDLPKQNPKWWCKVEDGYILNLLGEKKNKVPYDYES